MVALYLTLAAGCFLGLCIVISMILVSSYAAACKEAEAA